MWFRRWLRHVQLRYVEWKYRHAKADVKRKAILSLINVKDFKGHSLQNALGLTYRGIYPTLEEWGKKLNKANNILRSGEALENNYWPDEMIDVKLTGLGISSNDRYIDPGRVVERFVLDTHEFLELLDKAGDTDIGIYAHAKRVSRRPLQALDQLLPLLVQIN